jgi:hypothetical protein
VTETDPIVELADTLYDALYAITPYAEPHFADENEGLENAVRAVLTQAAAQQWIQKQLDETGIRSMDFRNGMHMELEGAREFLAHQVAAARAMLGDAPNYSETKLEWDVKVAESPELYTIVIQRHAPGALTPHEARQKAEARVAELEAVVSNAQKLIAGWKQASEEHARFAQSRAMGEMPGMADKQNGRSDQLADCADELADVLTGEDPDEWAYGIGMDVTDAGDRDG